MKFSLFGRAVAAAAVTLALATSASPANAGPVAPPTTGSSQAPDAKRGEAPTPGYIKPPSSLSGGAKYTWKLSTGQYAGAKRVAKATSPAHTNSRGQIDNNWVEKSFGSHKSDMYNFMIGWWYRTKDWSQVTNMSKADKQRVVNYAKTHGGANPKLRVAAGTVTKVSPATVELINSTKAGYKKAPTKCEGKTGYANDNARGFFWVWTNSCDTDNLVDLMDWGYQGLGVMAAILGIVGAGIAAIPAVVWAGELWTAKKLVENRQKRSTLRAVIFRFAKTPVTKSGKVSAPLWIYAQ